MMEKLCRLAAFIAVVLIGGTIFIAIFSSPIIAFIKALLPIH